jgi:hypothetical protein
MDPDPGGRNPVPQHCTKKDILLKRDIFVEFLLDFIQHCFICRPSGFTVAEDDGIEPWNVTALEVAVRRSNNSARSHG